MFYRIEVFDDGDVVVTKVPNKKPFDFYYYLRDLDSLKRELMDYGVQEIDNNLTEIVNSQPFEPIKCY